MTIKDTSSGPPPLYVDLDGTLIVTDTLFAGLKQLARRRPWLLPLLPLFLLGGRAGLKERVAGLTELDVAGLPYRQDVLEYIHTQKDMGRTVVLATAAHRSIADSVASYLGIFDDVIATDRDHNLKGRAKLEAIQRHSGGGGFVYMGDSSADIPIIRAASAGILVYPSRQLREAVEKSCNIERIFD